MPRRPALLQTYLALFAARPTRAGLDRYRDKRLRELVAFAYRHVPYYRDAFDAHGVGPTDVRGARDLPKLPLLERRALREQPERLLPDTVDPARTRKISSSGATGEPVRIYRLPLESHVLNTVRMRAEQQIGRRRGMKLASIIYRRPGEGGPPSWRHRIAAMAGFLSPRRIDILMEPQQIIDDLRRDPPDMLNGFAGTVTRIADAVGPGGLSDLGVSFVCVGGEVSTPAQRERIGRAFDAPVMQRYGCIEFNLIACQCPSSDLLHVCEHGVIAELLGADGAPVGVGQPGEVVATGLHGFTMPLIRYRVGDVAVRGPSPCACGAPNQTISEVQGRMIDLLTLADGRQIHPWTLTIPMLGAHDWIGQYRLTQRRIDRFELEVVPNGPVTTEARSELVRFCAERLGDGVHVELEVVDAISPEPSGKYRLVRSMVPARV